MIKNLLTFHPISGILLPLGYDSRGIKIITRKWLERVPGITMICFWIFAKI